MPTLGEAIEKAKELVKTCKDPADAACLLEGYEEIKRLGLDELLYMLCRPWKYGYISRGDVIGFIELLEERLRE